MVYQKFKINLEIIIICFTNPVYLSFNHFFFDDDNQRNAQLAKNYY